MSKGKTPLFTNKARNVMKGLAYFQQLLFSLALKFSISVSTKFNKNI